jgi:cyclase
MKYKRIIARLDVKNGDLVKGVQLEGLRVLGKPIAFAKNYYNNGIDEIFYMDIVASLYGRNSLLEIIKESCGGIFVPITVGGGIRSVKDVQDLLLNGADKVAVNTAATKTPSIIKEIANKFGSSTLSVVIEVIRESNGSYQVYTDCGREPTGIDAIEWAERVEDLGAGEIILTSVEREGTGKGLDLELTNQICRLVNIPVVIHGGVGNSVHVLEAFQKTKASAVCCSSIFHYNTIKTVDTQINSSGGNTEFYKSFKSKSGIDDCSILDLKQKLIDHCVSVRF